MKMSVLFSVILLSLSACSDADENDGNNANTATNNANTATNNSSSNNGSSIGADGGSVSANGVTLTIPAGALATQTAIAIEELTQDSAELPDGAASASSAFAVTPHGQTFEQAVTLVIPTTGRADTVLRLADANDTEWEVVNDVTFEDGKATVRTTTFSIYIAVNMCNDYCTTVTGLCGTMRGECEPRCNQVGIRGSQSAACVTAEKAVLSCYQTKAVADFTCSTHMPLADTCKTERDAAAVACAGANDCPCFDAKSIADAYADAKAFNANGVPGNDAPDYHACFYSGASWLQADNASSIWVSARPTANDPMNWEGNFGAGKVDGQFVCAVWSEQMLTAAGPVWRGPMTISDTQASACLAELGKYQASTTTCTPEPQR